MELSLDHPAVSRQHALLRRRGRRWVLEDLNSTNGLWWRGRRVQELELRDGDRISLAPASEPGAPSLRFLNPAEQGRRRLERLLGFGLLTGLGATAALMLIAVLDVPIRGRLATVQGPIAIYDRLNKPLESVDSSRHRELKTISAFSPALVDALLSSEDNRFWWHPGVDPIGTLRAFATNLSGGRLIEGGSSLTQQLARSLYPDQVGQGDTLGRKWRELLVGLLPSPNGHDPCRDPQRALEARNRVLNKMADAGRLSLEEARLARRQPIQLAKAACSKDALRRSAPFYTDQVRRDLSALVGPDVAAEGNFLIETHLDPVLQQVVERQLQELLNQAQGLGVGEGAAVVIDSRNGGVLAIAGGRDYRSSQFNRATMALRQPGSTFKLLTYLAALQRGIKPGDGIDCSTLEWGGQRFESSCNGRLSLTSAFASSSNTAALRLARRVGLEQVVRQARALGINTPLDPVPGLALGQSEVRLIELTSAYAAVANDGLWHPPTTIRRLLDAESCTADTLKRCGSLTGDGSTQVSSARRAISKDVARRMQTMLRAVVRGGTGSAASLGGLEGGKTGTTNDGRDLLFIGYEPSRHWVLGIWLGNDDNSPTASSSALAASLWGDIMRAAGRGSAGQR